VTFALHKSQNSSLAFFLNEQTLETVVFNATSGHVYALAGLSSLIWECLEAGLSLEETRKEAKRLAASEGLETELSRLVQLFETGGVAEDVWPGDYEQALLGLADFKPELLLGHDYEAYVCLHSWFYLACDDKRLRAVIAEVLQNIRAMPQELGEFEVSLASGGSGGEGVKAYFIHVDADNNLIINGQRRLAGLVYSEIVPRLFGVLRQLIKQDSGFEWAIHAAVLKARGSNQVIILPAASGSGKTTLSALLLQRGFDYLGDELALLDASFKVMSMPVGLGVKRGSYKPLEDDYPELSRLEECMRPTGIAVKYLPVERAKSVETLKPDERLKLGAWVFPQYTNDQGLLAGGTCQFNEVSVTEALQLLFSAGMHTAEPLGLELVESLLKHLSAKPRYRLYYSDIDQASAYLSAI